VGLSIFATFVSSPLPVLPAKAYTGTGTVRLQPVDTRGRVDGRAHLRAALPQPEQRVGVLYLETRFGPWARVYAYLCYLVTQGRAWDDQYQQASL
jgi:SSS family solute:Na+ symporter